ncbi:nuclease-like protein [Echria macrotheca]|uniref:Nuclease-like protein n=1 Tax=Echria macrotheca TaxID=438768 RepID=A0AAJ0FA14_9PEZI|nr:nuclease-like protein [Echria macrotheca]
MPANREDPWISSQVIDYNLSDLDGCAIAVDASYYLQQIIDAPPCEPLVTALGGLTGIEARLEDELENWTRHRITPFFIFDGQPVTGQDEVTSARLKSEIERGDQAWHTYFNNKAIEAVEQFGQIKSYRPQHLYRLLQSLLRKQGLHFLVVPSSAAAQLAYFDMIDSAQCAGIMGPLELMLYPINDCVIRSINWESSKVWAISKKHVLKALNATEYLFIDALLMTGTSFLPAFPPLEDENAVKIQPYSVSDAVNMLRAHEKSVTLACTTFGDILKARDPNWLEKYRRARMSVDHFIYIAESGEVKVHNSDTLTMDCHEYLGYQLPSELYHYLNTGLIGPRVLGWITHGQLFVLPTLDGVASEEYKNLVENGSARIKEAALSVMTQRLNRGISHKNIIMKVWYNSAFSSKVWDGHEPKFDFATQVASWSVQEPDVKSKIPNFAHGSILSEVAALEQPGFAALTLVADKNPREKPKPIESTGLIQSICLWRFLHIRGYIDDKHELTRWGKALLTALSSIQSTAEKYPQTPTNLYEQVLVAFELLRLGLLNTKNKHEELKGLPIYNSVEDQTSLLLVSRCATLLKLRHRDNGYTGPLNKNLLAYRSLICEVRAADRDLVEAIVGSMFMSAQAKRDRDDCWELSNGLPFLSEPDASFGIAVKTYFDEVGPKDTPEMKEKKKGDFTERSMPYATAFSEDLDIACRFFDALYAGVKTLDKEISADDQKAWKSAAAYLDNRR